MLKFVTVVLYGLAISVASASSVYKSIDRYGNVTYSSELPESAVEVEQVTIPPPPSEEEQLKALERSRQLIERSDDLVRQRMELNLELAKEKSRARQAVEARRAEEARLEYDQQRQNYPLYGWTMHRSYPPSRHWRPMPPRPPAYLPRPKPRPSGKLYWPDLGRY